MKLYARGAVHVGDGKIYVPAANFNALFCIDIKDWTVKYLTFFEKYAKEQPHLFGKGIVKEDRIYFMPYIANHIAVYQLKDCSQKYIQIGDKRERICDSFLDEEIAWLFMMSYPNRIVKVDFKSQRVEEQYLDWKYIFRFTGMKELDLTEQAKKYTILSVQRCDDIFWIVLYKIPGILLTYNIQTNKTEVHRIEGMENEVFSSAVALENCIWINVTNRKKLIRWEEETNKLDIIDYEATDADEVNSVMAYIENYIIIARGKELISIDVTDYTCKTMYYSKKIGFLSFERIENKILFYPNEGDDIIVIFDAAQNEISEHRLKWEQKLDAQLMQEWFNGYIGIERGCGVDEFLNAVPLRKEREKNGREYNSIGSLIWKGISQ